MKPFETERRNLNKSAKEDCFAKGEYKFGDSRDLNNGWLGLRFFLHVKGIEWNQSSTSGDLKE